MNFGKVLEMVTGSGLVGADPGGAGLDTQVLTEVFPGFAIKGSGKRG